MGDSARAIFQQAEQHLATGLYQEAVGEYLRVIRGVPEFFRARFRVADALLNLRARQPALAIYNALAWHAIKAGQPLLGLVAIKMAAAIDASATDAVEILAQLYSKDSDRVGQTSDAPSPRQLQEADPAGSLDGLSDDALIATAAREAANTDAIANYPAVLPAIPLFSFLEEDAFVTVLEGLRLRRFVRGNVVIQEGAPGDSFFILSEGSVDVTRQMQGRPANLARLRAGAVFGEMALISKAPRTATVTANCDSDMLELKRASLEDQAHKLASVTRALKDFTHERFLANLTSTSPLFKPFPRSMRTQIIKKFKDFPVDPGDELIAEGEEGQGLFLILKGTVEVTKRDESGQQLNLAQLKEGDVFGEISLVQETPTTATVTSRTRGELLFLPKNDFKSETARHPELFEELKKLTSERMQKNKQMMDPETYELIEDDDLIML